MILTLPAALLAALAVAGSAAVQHTPSAPASSQSAGPQTDQAASQAAAQTPPAQAPDKPKPPVDAPPLVDAFDLLRKIRNKELTPQEEAAANDPSRPMYAFAPVIGYKPSSGAQLGVAGNVALFLGNPETTHISSAVASVTVSTKKQVSASARFSLLARDDRWKLDGDNRFQWTSQDTFGLGTETPPDGKVNVDFDYFRVYETVYRELISGLFGGIGFHYSAHTGVGPGKDADAAWSESPYVEYSEQHGFPLESQTSAGASANLAVDTRDNFINAERGWFGSVTYRAFFDGFLGGDSAWQQLVLDARTYRKVSSDGRHKLAFWLFADMVVGGVAPYLDLPATGMDTYGRSARGYAEGRLRGERLLYGEIEYRATLMSNGLLGMVAFLNTSTFADRHAGEALFDHFASAGGAGVRLLINKRSKTNLCLDIGFGQKGSNGVYLAVQEAF